MSAIRATKVQLQTQDSQMMAESSATESVSRGPRRTRRASNNNNSAIGNTNYNNNNNMSDYGSPKPLYKSVSGKQIPNTIV